MGCRIKKAPDRGREMITKKGTNVQGESHGSSRKCYLFDFLVMLFCCRLQSVTLTPLTCTACSCIAPFFLPTHFSWANKLVKGSAAGFHVGRC